MLTTIQPCCMAAWGVVSGLTAITHDFKGLVLVRFFLGFVEAPYFPGALFLLSSWYSRKELALRTSILYTGSLLSGGLGGLVGAGIQSGLDGARGIPAWKWLFIIEAGITVFVALCAILILPDFPHNTKFLSAEERAIAVHRLQEVNGSRDTERGGVLQGVRMAVTDYKVWLLALVIITKTSAGAVTSFIPTLVKTFGYGKIETLLLVAPPYVFAAAVGLAISFSSDKRAERSLHIVVPIFFAMAGYIIAASSMALAARYLSLFLMLGGVYGSYNVALAWISSTLPRPLEKRSAAIALINTVGNIAQIYSPYLYLKQNGPRYLTAMIANAMFCLACLLATLALRWLLARENAKLEVAEMTDGSAQEKAEDIELEVVGTRGPTTLTRGFRYLL
jgi:MFS family permease